MQQKASFLSRLWIPGYWLVLLWTPSPISAEMYVAGTAGVNFADRINTIAGTGASAGVPDLNPAPNPDFDLQNSITFGGKAGYFPGHSWIGIERAWILWSLSLVFARVTIFFIPSAPSAERSPTTQGQVGVVTA